MNNEDTESRSGSHEIKIGINCALQSFRVASFLNFVDQRRNEFIRFVYICSFFEYRRDSYRVERIKKSLTNRYICEFVT